MKTVKLPYGMKKLTVPVPNDSYTIFIWKIPKGWQAEIKYYESITGGPYTHDIYTGQFDVVKIFKR